MVAVFPPEAWTGAIGNQFPVAGPPIPCRAGERTTSHTRQVAADRATIRANQTSAEKVLKFLVIAALFALLFLLLYSRLYPYIQALKKILGAAKTMVDPGFDSNSAMRGTATRADSKLVRCVGCGTWVPAERAIGASAGKSVYCSRECLEKSSDAEKQKLAG